MKVFVALLIVATALISNDYGQTTAKKSPSNKTYDAKLAKKLGADELGMKTYVFAMLKRGKNQVDEAKRKELIDGHLKNIHRLADEGKLVLAGPFMDNGDWTGVFVFDVRTVEEAQKLVETDPTIKVGLFEVELHLWYCSAALLKIPKMHKTIQKKDF